MLVADLHRSAVVRLLALASLLVGSPACSKVETSGPDAQGYTWRKDGVAVDKAGWRYHTTKDIFLHCGLEPNAQSCALSGVAGTFCDIWLPLGAPAWMIAHEEKHCEGWTHPGHLKKSDLR